MRLHVFTHRKFYNATGGLVKVNNERALREPKTEEKNADLFSPGLGSRKAFLGHV